MFNENLRAAYRSLRSAPGFTFTAVLSLSIGIGGSVAMFTLVNSVLLKPLAYHEPGRLVLVTNITPKVRDVPVHGLVPLQFIRWREEIQSFQSFAVARGGSGLTLTGAGQPETLGALRISSGFFETLGVSPRLGRWFTRADEQRGGPNIVIVSDSLWRRRFSAAADLVGKQIVLSDTPYLVVGVTPPDLRLFRGRQLQTGSSLPDRADIFLPIRFTAEDELGLFRPIYAAFARLQPGTSPEKARAELDATLPTFSRQVPALPRMNTGAGVQPLQTALVGSVRLALLLLLGSVGLVLLIACVNVANLSLVRATQRSRELAIRVALGARKTDLVAYLLTESLLLALAGLGVGALLSTWITAAFIVWAPAQAPRIDEVAIDSNVLWFAMAVCALTTVLCGILPAWHASRTDPQQAMKTGARGNPDASKGGRLRSGLVAAEVALGTVLLVGSGLLLASLHHVVNAPLGVDGHDLLVGDLLLPSPKYQDIEKQVSFARNVRDLIASLPAVRNVAVSSHIPLVSENVDAVLPEGGGDIQSITQSMNLVAWPSVSPEFFRALRIPVRAGRLFRDEGEPERVAVVSESAARILWPGEDPIGKRVSKPVTEDPKIYWRVIGIVGDVRSSGLDRLPRPTIYRSFTQKGVSAFSVVLRAGIAPDALAETVRQTVRRVDPDIAMPEFHTMPEVVARSVQQRRFQAILLTAFAVLAVLLAIIGIYGVVAYSIVQRRKEIGVRLALGASTEDLRRLILRNGMMPVFAGLSAGLIAAAFFSRLTVSLLFEVKPLDPATFLVAPMVLVLAAVAPCWLNARRAARTDPVIALRYE